jgi:hypothetical protein
MNDIIYILNYHTFTLPYAFINFLHEWFIGDKKAIHPRPLVDYLFDHRIRIGQHVRLR